VPLVSWNLGGAAPTAFLTTGIESSNGVDSAKPPIGAVASDLSAVTPNSFGFGDTAQIAAVAYLLAHSGDSPDPATVAEVAELIPELVGVPTGQSCLQSAQNNLNRAAAQALWAQAQQAAGPYHLALAVTPPVSRPGVTVVVRATVKSALGYPVGGIAVTFQPSGVSAITAADGIASAPVTPPVTPGQTAIVFSASVSAPIGLTAISMSGAAPAIAVAPPIAVAANVTVPLDQSANPNVQLSTSTHLVLPGAGIKSTVAVTGLNGHSATASVTVVGPIAADASGSCTAITTSAWTAALAMHTVGTAHLNLFGDGAVPGPTFSPATPGCYSLGLQLMTNDAVPPASRTTDFGQPGASVTVLPLGLEVAATHNGVALPGVLAAAATVTHSLGATGSIGGSLLGPVPPLDGSCAKLSWGRAPTAARIAPTFITGDGAHPVTSEPVRSIGCYAMQMTATFTVSGQGSVSILIPASATGLTFLVLEPQLDIATSSTWGVPGTVALVKVGVYGSLRQKGTLRTALMWLAPPVTGCQAADWSRATLIATSPPGPTVGDGSYSITAPAAPKAGCYRVVPSLTLTGIATVISTPTDTALAVFQIGDPVVTFTPKAVSATDDRTRTWFTLGTSAATLLAAVGQTVRLAFRRRDADDG
jgi:hypothetical protein